MNTEKTVCPLRGFITVPTGQLKKTLLGEIPELRAEALKCRNDCEFYESGCLITAALKHLKDIK